MENDAARAGKHCDTCIDGVRAPAERAKNAKRVRSVRGFADDAPIKISNCDRTDNAAVSVRCKYGLSLAQGQPFYKRSGCAGRHMLIRIAYNDFIRIAHQRKHFAPPRGLGSKD